jgi:hypothetical protein
MNLIKIKLTLCEQIAGGSQLKTTFSQTRESEGFPELWGDLAGAIADAIRTVQPPRLGELLADIVERLLDEECNFQKETEAFKEAAEALTEQWRVFDEKIEQCQKTGSTSG